MSVRRSLYLLIFSIAAAGCAANMNLNDRVIAVVGDKKITYGDFKRQYEQNNLSTPDTAQSFNNKENFLNLLVDYNLKLLDAEKQGMIKDPQIENEMKDYESQLAVSYILEHEITDPMVKKIYDRRKFEVRANQVFIQIQKDSANPEGDTLKAYNEAMQVIKEVKGGASMDSLAKIYRGGETYYITAGTFLQYAGGEEFENMLYSLKPGEVGSVPVRTPFGYLVVQLVEKNPRVEAVRASHILIPIAGKTPADTLAAYDKAVAVLDSAKSGVDFAKLAEDNSSDKYSAIRGGDLGYFKRGMMVRPFDEAVFKMKLGEITGPIRTQFGYHIIKLTGIQPIPPFSEEKAKIRQEYLNGGYKYDLENFVNALKQEMHYKLDEIAVRSLYDKLDSTQRFGEADFDSLLTKPERHATLFSFDNSVGTVDTLISLGTSEKDLSGLVLSWNNIHTIIDRAAKQMLLSSYALKKAPTYPEFDTLMSQYENGILIYQIEQEEVWNKVVASDSVLRPYYFDHLSRYYWPKRVELSEIHVYNDSLANAIYDSLKNGGDFDSLAVKYTTRTDARKNSGRWGLFADSSNTLATLGFSMKEDQFSKPIPYEGGFSIIRVDKFEAPRPKTFEEARGEVSSDYQEVESKRIQKTWLDKLRKEFGVTINEKSFRELVAEK